MFPPIAVFSPYTWRLTLKCTCCTVAAYAHAESRRISPACSREHIMEPIVGLSRPGCESLDLKVGKINLQTVANAFRVSPKIIIMQPFSIQ